jgi:hypothetical protein
MSRCSSALTAFDRSETRSPASAGYCRIFGGFARRASGGGGAGDRPVRCGPLTCWFVRGRGRAVRSVGGGSAGVWSGGGVGAGSGCRRPRRGRTVGLVAVRVGRRVGGCGPAAGSTPRGCCRGGTAGSVWRRREQLASRCGCRRRRLGRRRRRRRRGGGSRHARRAGDLFGSGVLPDGPPVVDAAAGVHRYRCRRPAFASYWPSATTCDSGCFKHLATATERGLPEPCPPIRQRFISTL